jgi:hypothetical protein
MTTSKKAHPMPTGNSFSSLIGYGPNTLSLLLEMLKDLDRFREIGNGFQCQLLLPVYIYYILSYFLQSCVLIHFRTVLYPTRRFAHADVTGLYSNRLGARRNNCIL